MKEGTDRICYSPKIHNLLSQNEVPLYGKDILSLQKRCADFDRAFERLDYSFVPSLQAGSQEEMLLPQYIKTLEQTKELVTKQLGAVNY